MTATGQLLDAVLAAALAAPAAGLGRLARRRPADSRWLRLLALGLLLEAVAGTVRAAGAVADVIVLHHAAGAVSLVAPAVLLGGLVLAARRRVPGLRSHVLLDGLAGALAGAAVAALALAPLAELRWDGSWTGVVTVGRPLLTAAVLAAAVGSFGVLGGRHLRQLGAWTVGLAAVCAVDTARSMGLVDSDVAVQWAGAVTLVGYLLVAAGAWQRCPEAVVPLPGARSLTVPALSSLAAVAVLTVSPDYAASPAPSVLALCVLALCAARFVRVLVQLRELADVREQALTDELTGVANRRALYLHLDALLSTGPSAGSSTGGPPAGPPATQHGAVPAALPVAQSGAPERDAGHAGHGTTPATATAPHFAVGLIDLDHFKEVNDTLGHAVGDALLKGVTERFLAALEELETPHLFARLGGDEFAVVLHEVTSKDAALLVGEALVESLAEPLPVGDAVLHAQASIGLAVTPTHGRTRGELLFAADAAMYAAKTSGQRVRFHAPRHDEKSAQLELAEELYAALERDELTVVYQPVCTVGGAVVGAEALVRWQHPGRGLLMPAQFLGAAERYRLTGPVLERVLALALGDLARWRAYGAPLTVSVNLAAADLRDDAVVATVAAALLEHRLPAEALTLDVREVDVAAGGERAVEVLHALHELGVRLALDDYGVGGVGIAALASLPLDVVKLERRFARDVAVSERHTGVVRATVDLAHALGLRLLAEGVEDRRGLARLAELGCDLVQGWQVGRPGTADELERLLSRPAGGKHRLVPDQPSHGDPHAAPRPVGGRPGRRASAAVRRTHAEPPATTSGP